MKLATFGLATALAFTSTFALAQSSGGGSATGGAATSGTTTGSPAAGTTTGNASGTRYRQTGSRQRRGWP